MIFFASLRSDSILRMDVRRFISRIESAPWYEGQISHIETIPARQAKFAALDPPLSERIRALLAGEGIEALYSHQVEAISNVREGKSVVLVTGTASGKTLAYNVPALEALLADPASCALYIYPTKALAQDQLRTLQRYQAEDPLLPLKTGTYDGDTPPSMRRKLKNEANVLLTNPDMLHAGILPNHGTWARFFSNLRFVVVDEIHTYRGVFGSNVSHVLNRLNRICRHYGSSPVYICCSATIHNPLELAEKLTRRTMHLVDEDGSPRGEKAFVFWNPPFLDDGGMERRSSNMEAARLMAELVADGVQTIAFVRARVVSEVITKYVKEELARLAPSKVEAVKSYRGGYLPEERRRIEQELFSGRLNAVVSTNALELGIDVGSLEAALLAGYPGTIASSWQQAGRAGRGEAPSLAVLVSHNSPIDQYMVQHHEYFFGRSPENAVIDPFNPHIVLSHLRSAAYELPLEPQEWGLFGEYCGAVLRLLEENREVRFKAGRHYWCGGSYPSADVQLRNIGDDIYTIVEEGEANRVIGTIDETSAHMQVHPEAVYMHDCETYFVNSLDMVKKIAFVEKTDTDYYTQSITEVKIKIEKEEIEKKWRRSKAYFGDLSVTSVTFMFKKIKFGSRDSLGYGSLDLPPLTLLTTGFWIVPPREAYGYVREAGRVPREGLLGVANVMKEVIPVFVMCDTMDVGASVDSSAADAPALFVYDRYPGGLGFAHKVYEMIEEVMEGSLELLDKCPCGDGCPSCVGSPIPAYSQNDPDGESRGMIPDKEAAKSILHYLLEKEPYVPARAAKGAARVPAAEAPAAVFPKDMKELPIALEKKLRERMSRYKRNARR